MYDLDEFFINPEPINLPCGGVAEFDRESTIGAFRCMNCYAVVGSTGMPDYCKEAAEAYEAWEKLGGEGWDYTK